MSVKKLCSVDHKDLYLSLVFSLSFCSFGKHLIRVQNEH